MAKNIEAYNHEEKLRTIIHSNHHIRDSIQRNVDNFLKLREDLLANSGMQQLPAYKDILLPLIEGPCIEQLNARIVSDKVQLAFCGENSSGKSAFIHTFLGVGKILPSGDGPVTARITKLTYALGEQARICIRKTLRDPTLIKDEIPLSNFFASEKPKWMNIKDALSKHLKRPDDKSSEFADWARCLVEIHIPSPILALGIDVYDTPGFLLDDAPVLKDILHDLVEFIHPTIIFMYSNPSTDDATNGCFLAMKTALQDLDNASIFFLNSKADINQMLKFKENMNIEEFLSVLSDERTRRYRLLVNAPFLVNNQLEGLPESIDDCRCFDLCSVNSQLAKPYGPLMNETTIQRIIEFVANSDLVVATRICRRIFPIINAFFDLLLETSYRTPEQLLQLHYDFMNWEQIYFEAYTMFAKQCLKDLLSNIFARLDTEAKVIAQPFLNLRTLPDSLRPEIQTAVRLYIITPAIRDTLRRFKGYVFEHIASNCHLTRGAIFNEILNQALGQQEISDSEKFLFNDQHVKESTDISMIYMVNTISTPIVQCAQSLQNLDFSRGTAITALLDEIREPSGDQERNHQERVYRSVCRYLFSMRLIIEKQRETMRQAVRLWGDQQKAILRSLIDLHYETVSPLLSSHRETLNYLERYICDFVIIECELRIAQDSAKFNGNKLEIQSSDSKSTIFSIFIADWGTEKNLVVKKLSQPLFGQPNAAFYEAHYHLKVTNLRHPNIVHLRYLYQHHLDNQAPELWMIFPPMTFTLEQFLQRESVSISIQTAIKWMNGIVDALAALHGDELVHRNVILSNILLDEKECTMLADLGDWHGNCDLSVRHKPSSTLNGTNDDMKGFGEIGQFLNTFIEKDEKISTIIEEFTELMLLCAQASYEMPVTAEFAQKKLKFWLAAF
jgi:hypothetical protein